MITSVKLKLMKLVFEAQVVEAYSFRHAENIIDFAALRSVSSTDITIFTLKRVEISCAVFMWSKCPCVQIIASKVELFSSISPINCSASQGTSISTQKSRPFNKYVLVLADR